MRAQETIWSILGIQPWEVELVLLALILLVVLGQFGLWIWLAYR